MIGLGSGYDMEITPITLLLILCLGIHRSSSDILQRQKRNWIIDSFAIEEENDGPFPYLLGTIEVEKKLTILKLRGEGVEKEPVNILKINSATGEIMVYGKVNYETHKKLKLQFEAFDSNKRIVDTRLGVEVNILDINDNTPEFQLRSYEVSLKESDSQGTYMVTVSAHDSDDSKTNNGTFDLRIVSVTPNPTDMEFYIEQKGETGTIGFKGCLDYEKAQKYTILVEAKDRGEKKQLSSTSTVIINIQDGNNHLPVFTGQTGPGRVKEKEEHVLVWRLQVTDKDTKGTAAWKAKYKIHGDTNKHFSITTDPETNEGLLYVEKHLDYEDDSLKNLSVSVENEAPYYSCKVRGRPNANLWDVVTIGGESGTPLSTRHVTVTVEDVNDPPFFPDAVKDVTVVENTAVGHYLETFTAKDLDTTYANTFVYMQGEDPGNWTTVDAKTGRITTKKILDRESPFVKDNIYKVTIYAVDNGKPPMTGTGTLNIHLIDQNDNVPNLTVSTMDMCLSDGHSLVNITAFDRDEEPNSGPFRFKLQGDVEGKWKVDPGHGYSVNLVKENTVYAGHHELLLEVFDLQGQSAVHNLSITVCNCLDTMMVKPNCRVRRSTGTVGGGAIGIIFIAILFLLGFLLLALLLSCKREIKLIPHEASGESLMKSNSESRGTDCQVVFKSLNQGDSQKGRDIQTISDASTIHIKPSLTRSVSSMRSVRGRSEHPMYLGSELYKGGNTMHRSSSMRAGQGHWLYSMYHEHSSGGYHLGNSMNRGSAKISNYSERGENDYLILSHVLDQTLHSLHAPGKQLGDYAPHVYAEEGDPGTNTDLDAISNPEIPFDTDALLDLDPKFNTLASICRPDATTS